MKTLAALTLVTTLTVGVSSSAQANSITETISAGISNQLTELSSNIKQQANAAMQKTMLELFFAEGNKQAEQSVSEHADDIDTEQTESNQQ
ncbi:MAG TPA: hypothetical protein VLA40_16095 [Rheinheimera sp.]|nr:hypothetical protein [Rheinheimera sp.]